MPTFFMKLLFYYPFCCGEWRSFMVAYGLVVLSFLRRQRQPHLKLPPCPSGAQTVQGTIVERRSLAPWHTLTSMSLPWCSSTLNSTIIGHLANFYFMIFYWLLPMCQVLEIQRYLQSLTWGNLQSLWYTVFQRVFLWTLITWEILRIKDPLAHSLGNWNFDFF